MPYDYDKPVKVRIFVEFIVEYPPSQGLYPDGGYDAHHSEFQNKSPGYIARRMAELDCKEDIDGVWSAASEVNFKRAEVLTTL